VTVATRREELPAGGAPLEAADYLDFIEREYLAGYVARGGCAVKLMVTGNDVVARELADGLGSIGDGFLHIAIDAAGTRVHMIDQIFGAVARQVDWLALADAVVRRAYDRTGFPAPDKDGELDADTPALSVTTLAAYHDVDPTELYRSVRRTLERDILDDVTLSHEFRVAMLRLCQERLGRGDVDAAERDTVLGWLRGERLPAAALRRASLHARVARHNARPLLVSLSRWIRRAGHAGMVLELDLERLGVGRRPPAGLRDGHYYSKAAALDTYEVLRQLIDATDELEGLFLAVLLPVELVTDEARGLPAYTALQLRVADEVRDRRRPNPYANLVRLGVRMEAVR
jgi:hypothetical protein